MRSSGSGRRTASMASGSRRSTASACSIPLPHPPRRHRIVSSISRRGRRWRCTATAGGPAIGRSPVRYWARTFDPGRPGSCSTSATTSRSRATWHRPIREVGGLKSLFGREAARNRVFPISRGRARRLQVAAMEEAGRYVLYPGNERYSDWGFPNLRRRSWSITARVQTPADGGSGAIVNQGGRFAGWGLFLLNGVPNFAYRSGIGELATLRLRAVDALDAGPHVLEVHFVESPSDDAAAADPRRSRPADITMKVDGIAVAQGANGCDGRECLHVSGARLAIPPAAH